jgi:DNA polymerase III delta prime subunit
VIPVDAIRGLIQATAQATHQSGNRVVIIGSAEAMNSNAANALLKTLEEPPLGSYFILTTSQPGRLIPTILSRCQQYVISANSQQAMNWLQDQQLTATAGLLAQFQNAPLALQDFINSEDNAAMLQFQSAYQHWVEGDLSALQQMQQVIMIAPEKRIDWLITRVALEIKQSTMALAHCLIPWYQSLLTSRRLLSQSGFNQVLQIEKLISNGAQIDRGSTI